MFGENVAWRLFAEAKYVYKSIKFSVKSRNHRIYFSHVVLLESTMIYCTLLQH
jgi:hypothetical protein